MKAFYVKKARKDNPVAKKGEPYYWWKPMFGEMQFSITPPSRAQLTDSAFLQEVYGIEDGIAELPFDCIEDLSTFADDIRTLGAEQQERLDNMPEQLQCGQTGELLQQRADSCEEWAALLEDIDTTVDDNLTEEERRERIGEILAEIRECVYQGE